MAQRFGDELMLCNVAVANLPLQDVIPAAAEAGFDSISVVARAHRRAVERDGITNATLRALLRDHDIVVRDVEASGDWLGQEPDAERAWLKSVYDTDQLLRLANDLDASTLVATHFGAPARLEVAAEAFGLLCDRAAVHGLQVALEFPAMATVADVRTAWEIVRVADRSNAGLLVDNWHHFRSIATDDDLFAVPPERILSVQLSDGAWEPVGPPVEDVVHRGLPGGGDMQVVAFARALDGHGVRCPVGIEVLQRDIVEQGPVAAAKLLYDSLRAVIDEALAS